MKELLQLKKDCFDLLNDFKELNETIEQFFNDKGQEHIIKQEEILKNEKDDNKDLSLVINTLQHFKLSNGLAPAARYGLCVSLNSIIESSMYEICNFVYKLKQENEKDKPKTLENRIEKVKNSDGRKPPNIKRYGLYLEEVLKIELPRFFDKDLPLINRIRNKIAHKNGLLTGNEKTELIDLLSNFEENKTAKDPYYKLVRDGVTIETDAHNMDYIFLKESYLQGVRGKGVFMFSKLFEEIRKKLIDFQPSW